MFKVYGFQRLLFYFENIFAKIQREVLFCKAEMVCLAVGGCMCVSVCASAVSWLAASQTPFTTPCATCWQIASSSSRGIYRRTRSGLCFPEPESLTEVCAAPTHGIRNPVTTAGSEAMSAEQNRGVPRCCEHGGHHPQGRRRYQRVWWQVSFELARPQINFRIY